MFNGHLTLRPPLCQSHSVEDPNSAPNLFSSQSCVPSSQRLYILNIIYSLKIYAENFISNCDDIKS